MEWRNIFLDYDICIMCFWVQYSPDSSMSDWTSSVSLNAQIPKALKKGWTWEKAVQPSMKKDEHEKKQSSHPLQQIWVKMYIMKD